MSKKTKLSPCPFCGNDVYVVLKEKSGKYIIFCPTTTCYLRLTEYSQYGTEAACIRAWNRRNNDKE